MPYLLIWVALVGCGSGSSRPQFHLELSSGSAHVGTTSDAMSVEIESGQTTILELLVIGSATGPVTFSSRGLPSFARMQGPVLTLAPGRTDAGSFAFDLTASAGKESETASIALTVHRFNNPPVWTFDLNESLHDDDGYRIRTCPDPLQCTARGTPTVDIGQACDPDNDAIRVELEVVQRGQPFTGIATSVSDGLAGACTGVGTRLPGLVPGRSYEFAFRVTDQFGAIAVDSLTHAPIGKDGWLHQPAWGFDQGPCPAGQQCACTRVGQPCNTGAECCSGSCDPSADHGFGACLAAPK